MTRKQEIKVLLDFTIAEIERTSEHITACDPLVPRMNQHLRKLCQLVADMDDLRKENENLNRS